jgi:phosphate uptake regulator
MDIRKVQLTGGSSYVITLPKDWVKKLNIKKSDSLGMITQPDGTLLLTSRTSETRPHREKEITAGDIEEPEHLIRVLIGAYIMGYSTITVRSPGRIPPPIRDAVIRFAQMTIGPEIMEEGTSFITIRDLLNPVEMPFDKTVRRMHILVRTMHEDAMAALEKRERSLAEEVPRRDSDVNRLQWLTARQSNMMMGDMTLSRRMGVSLEEANSYFLISRIIERIGDHGVKIAKCVLLLLDHKLDRKMQTKMAAASSESLRLLSNSLDTWFKKDIKAANVNIDSLASLMERCDDINSDAQHIRSAYSIPVTDISESIRRTGEYAADISELVINNLVLGAK